MHTLGPWTLGQPLSRVESRQGELIAEVYTSEDDAYLIAAALEMLEALENALTALYADEFQVAELEEIIRQVEAAIRKAKGQE